MHFVAGKNLSAQLLCCVDLNANFNMPKQHLTIKLKQA